jgi:hypothetical protein
MTNTRIAQLLLEEGWNLHVNDDPAVPPVLLKMTQHDELLACPIEHDVVIDLYHQGLIVKHATIGSLLSTGRPEEAVSLIRDFVAHSDLASIALGLALKVFADLVNGMFLTSTADIVLLGGAAGVRKEPCDPVDPLRYCRDRMRIRCSGMFRRRTRN